MPEYGTLPNGWVEVEYDVEEQDDASDIEAFNARWASEDEKISVTARQSRDADGTVTYPVIVEQTLVSEEDGVEATVQSHARVEDTRKLAERMAIEFMHEVNDGMHRLRLMGVEKWKEFYQFYCISDSELPGSMTADQIINSIDNEQYDDDIDELPEEFEDEDEDSIIQIDVFPRHEKEIEEHND